MNTIDLELPWPNYELWPNGYRNRRAYLRAKAQAKHDAYYIARHMIGAAKWANDNTSIPVRLEFCPPTRRRYDLDGGLSACKWYMDQVAAVLGVDDAQFAPVPVRGPVTKGGKVIVRIGAKA